MRCDKCKKQRPNHMSMTKDWTFYMISVSHECHTCKAKTVNDCTCPEPEPKKCDECGHVDCRCCDYLEAFRDY
jgi:hypothetical protein